MIRRIFIYLNEMFPLSSFIVSLMTGVSIELVYLKLFGVTPLNLQSLLIPAFAITLISLLLRIMDEFKDYEDDLRNFPDRPLPSGKVQKKDLLVLGIICVGGVLVLSSTSKIMLILGTLNLVYSFLMLKWFFMEERMRKNLPFALVTHHPIVFLNFIYLVFSTMSASPSIDLSNVLYVLPVCFIFTNWEIARKIRTPVDETDYTTYSKIWGPRFAVSVAIVLQIIFVSGTYLILEKLNTPESGKMLFLIVELALMAPYTRFFKKLLIKTPFKKIAELQILSIVLTLLLAAIQ